VTRDAWALRPIVWFAAGSILITIVHEFAHACVAFALGVPSTLFNYSATIDLSAVPAGSNLPALIRIAGPLCALAVGLICWLVFRRVRDAPVELPLLFLSVFGVGTLLGNLMSTSFVGDFSVVAAALDVPATVRTILSVIGGVCLAALHFWAGRELVRWVPEHTRRVIGAIGIVVVPVVLGTAVVILVNQPMAAASFTARIAEASFWIFAVFGALLAGSNSTKARGSFAPQWGDGLTMLLAVLIVRLMARGIRFEP